MSARRKADRIYDDDYIFQESLIEEVKKFPNLWNPAVKGHLNAKLSRSAWQKIAEELRMYGKSGG